jgi:hypothetical protein
MKKSWDTAARTRWAVRKIRQRVESSRAGRYTAAFDAGLWGMWGGTPLG